jgi:hypothetical protein
MLCQAASRILSCLSLCLRAWCSLLVPLNWHWHEDMSPSNNLTKPPHQRIYDELTRLRPKKLTLLRWSIVGHFVVTSHWNYIFRHITCDYCIQSSNSSQHYPLHCSFLNAIRKDFPTCVSCNAPRVWNGRRIGRCQTPKSLARSVFSFARFQILYGGIFSVPGRLVTGFVRIVSCICADSFS